MTRRTGIGLGLIVLAAGLCAGPLRAPLLAQTASAQSASVPTFRVDTAWEWPPNLPGGQVVGVVSSVAVDRRDHVWVLHRARQVLPEVRERAAPPVLEFDAEGNFVQGWGGPAPGYDWPDTEHGLFVDHEDNVWITGLNPLERAYTDPTQRTDDMLLKLTRDGALLGQFGGRDRHPLARGGNADTAGVHLATEAVVHPATGEVFVADGYANRRVLVLDARTLAFKRMWGAFGAQPPPELGRDATENRLGMILTDDPDGPDQFNSVHGVKVSNDGLVYVADRNYRRIQVFRLDGTYLTQTFVNPDGADFMTVCTLAFSPDPEQRFIYVGDYGNSHIAVVARQTLETVASFGERGGEPGNFRGLHALAVDSRDSRGNLYTAETQPRPVGSRVQRFIYTGMSAARAR